MPSLAVIFENQEIKRAAGEISFGRSNDATVKLDRSESDPSLSRYAGALSLVESQWMATNTSSRAQMHVWVDGGQAAVIRVGAAPFPLPSPCLAELRIRTIKDYLLTIVVQGDMPPFRLPETESGTTTVEVADLLKLNDRERLLLAALAEPRLLDPQADAWTVPSTSDLRTRLGLRDKQLEKTLDNIARKMEPHLGDLIGDNSGRSTARRYRIVDFAIATGSVTAADLKQLSRP